jgi:hypothetical protein
MGAADQFAAGIGPGPFGATPAMASAHAPLTATQIAQANVAMSLGNSIGGAGMTGAYAPALAPALVGPSSASIAGVSAASSIVPGFWSKAADLGWAGVKAAGGVAAPIAVKKLGEIINPPSKPSGGRISDPWGAFLAGLGLGGGGNGGGSDGSAGNWEGAPGGKGSGEMSDFMKLGLIAAGSLLVYKVAF